MSVNERHGKKRREPLKGRVKTADLAILCVADMIFLFFFFKQKTAYEVGTGDWSSDVCSSDLMISIKGGALPQRERGSIKSRALLQREMGILKSEGDRKSVV